ncbi:hypothetical protein D9756_001025 [Leucocoprinus leucothites]|uniref:Uncharacterized protein n=1 Tax=Leucocoprinus leucothites TaxID=201217 RepID=A0A8H5LNU9_9AGAR|nr:hypothetical protein D9756_001025 [Leucoagaricus leucothites]
MRKSSPKLRDHGIAKQQWRYEHGTEYTCIPIRRCGAAAGRGVAFAEKMGFRWDGQMHGRWDTNPRVSDPALDVGDSSASFLPSTSHIKCMAGCLSTRTTQVEDMAA